MSPQCAGTHDVGSAATVCENALESAEMPALSAVIAAVRLPLTLPFGAEIDADEFDEFDDDALPELPNQFDTVLVTDVAAVDRTAAPEPHHAALVVPGVFVVVVDPDEPEFEYTDDDDDEPDALTVVSPPPSSCESAASALAEPNVGTADATAPVMALTMD